jgi:DNA-binding MarR family transcriptional regulator
VLIAQLSTAAGVRAPLSHVADQVFLELAREIEAQGVARKVVADMFGLALRTYQKKVQRLTESETVRDRTLWEAVLDHLTEHGSSSRQRILERFRHDGERNVAAVLNDLVNSGLVYRTGRGDSSLYGITSVSDYRQLLDEADLDSVASLVWVTVFRAGGMTRDELRQAIAVDGAALERALALLEREGRVERDGGNRLRASTFVVPVGSARGWEAAVFDHFQAVANAIASKLRRGSARSQQADVVGGATLSFDIHDGHPHKEAVLGLLQRVRADVNALWNQVRAHNEAHPIDDDSKTTVWFYFGQNIEESEDVASDPENAAESEGAQP